MKIAIAGFGQETNTFVRRPTALADFGRRPPGQAFPGGEALRAVFRGTGTPLGGALAVAEREQVAAEPLLWAHANSGGPVEQGAHDALLSLLIERLDRHRDLDGLLLDLHGSMVTTAQTDPDGRLLRTLRQMLGPRLPFALLVDSHANLSAEMLRYPDVIVTNDLYPHCDWYDRGAEAMELLLRLARREIRPRTAWRKLPLLTLPPTQWSEGEPMRTILDEVWAAEAEPGVLVAGFLPGFAFADVPEAGATVFVTTDGEPDLAEALVDRVAAVVWRHRGAFQTELQPVDPVIRYTLGRARRPVVLADGSDNPGGGAPGDGTVLLEALIEADVPQSLVAVLTDPETALQAHDAGVGATIRARLGGKTPDSAGRPLEVEAYVKHLCDGEFTYRCPMGGGMPGRLGATAVLEIGRVQVLVAAERVQAWDPALLRAAGIEPEELRLIVLKSAVHFRAGFTDLAERIFDADTPGVARPDFADLRYARVPRPIYPLDPDVVWPPESTT